MGCVQQTLAGASSCFLGVFFLVFSCNQAAEEDIIDSSIAELSQTTFSSYISSASLPHKAKPELHDERVSSLEFILKWLLLSFIIYPCYRALVSLGCVSSSRATQSSFSPKTYEGTASSSSSFLS